MADSSGLKHKFKKNQVIIQRPGDFPDVIDSDVVYFIDGDIDMGSIEITVPEGGLFINGHGHGISALHSSENNKTLFKNGLGTYSGDIIMDGLTMYMTGVGSKIFDVDNDGNNSAFEMNSCNVGTFSLTTTSLGSISNYRQIRTADFAAINYTDGFTFSGTFSGMAFNDSILLANVSGSTLFQSGVALLITNGMSSNMNALSLAVGSVWCDFDATNFAVNAVMSLNSFRTNLSAAIPNLSADDPKALFKSCRGIENTYIGGYWSIGVEAETVILAADTFVKVAGTTINTPESHFEAAGDNSLKYIGEADISVMVSCPLVVETNNVESLVFALRHYDDSAAAFTTNVDEQPVETQLKLLGDRQGQTHLIGVAFVSTNDLIELWVKNVSNTNNLTVLNNSKLLINERA